MTRELPKQVRRPDGTIFDEVPLAQLQEDFFQADSALWNAGVGYGEISINMFSNEESYLVFSFNSEAGFYCEAHICKRGSLQPTQCPKTSDQLLEQFRVWGGQMHFQVPAAFFVSREQAAEIASHFWLTGKLWDKIQWVNQREFGWDLA